jgi:hypothetical protein
MLKISIKDKFTGMKKEIQMTRTLNGDYVLKEHPEIDIIVMPAKNKILTLPKEDFSDNTYPAQDSFFNYMNKKGVIVPDSIKNSNIYNSLEAGYIPQPPGGENPLQVIIFNAASYIEDQRPSLEYEKAFQDTMEKELLKPSIEDSTELGEIPQEPFKGSIPKYGFPTRGIYRYNY